jgi:geranylgeranyl diphosphate synthase type I
MHSQLEAALKGSLELRDERSLDPLWTAARAQVDAYALRPGKRVRPLLSLIGYGLATGSADLGEAAIRTAAALELLHTFLLIHDDVADRAPSRRGGPSLQRVLADGKPGEDLAIVMGDHLFARSMELMLQTGSPHALEAALQVLSACRMTAAGQLLDLQFSRAPLAEVTLFQTLKVANLKTARYGFVAPLVCGAILGGASAELRESLERIGRYAGVAFQLRDDLIGLFGDERASGKSCASDFFEGKRTFPLIAAYTRADDEGRRELERLWDLPHKTETDLHRARFAVEHHGGRRATERVIRRLTRAANRALSTLPAAGPALPLLDHLCAQLAQRHA